MERATGCFFQFGKDCLNGQWKIFELMRCKVMNFPGRKLKMVKEMEVVGVERKLVKLAETKVKEAAILVEVAKRVDHYLRGEVQIVIVVVGREGRKMDLGTSGNSKTTTMTWILSFCFQYKTEKTYLKLESRGKVRLQFSKRKPRNERK